MRRFFLSAVAVLFLAANAPSANHSDLIGVWRIDTTDSPIVDGRLVTSGTLTIDYHHKLLYVGERTKFENGERSVEMECDVDGHEHPLIGTTHYVRAEWEGSTLVAVGAVDGGEGSIRFVLSPDGRTLTEIVRHEDHRGQFDRTLVWMRP